MTADRRSVPPYPRVPRLSQEEVRRLHEQQHEHNRALREWRETLARTLRTAPIHPEET